jgi:hypothetical protein
VRDDARETAIDSIEIVALQMVINDTICRENDRACKYADLNTGLMQINPDGIECTPLVAPIGRSHMFWYGGAFGT